MPRVGAGGLLQGLQRSGGESRSSHEHGKVPLMLGVLKGRYLSSIRTILAVSFSFCPYFSLAEANQKPAVIEMSLGNVLCSGLVLVI